jgi:glutathione S-transferase
MISIGVRAAEGAALLARHPRLAAWWAQMRARPSLAATATRSEA